MTLAVKLTLYHYAPVDKDSIQVDPKYFADRAKRSTFSMREYETSQVPRTFWYVDSGTKREQVSQGRKLYQATIPAEKFMILGMTLKVTRKNTDTQFMDYERV